MEEEMNRKERSEGDISGLIQRIQAGDGEAMEALYYLLEDELIQYLYKKMSRKLRNIESTRDMLQTLWKEVWKDIKQFDYRNSKSFMNWIKTCLLHKILNRARKKNRSIAINFTESDFLYTMPDPAAVPPVEVLGEKELLRKALAAFSTEHSSILQYRIEKKMEFDEIGRLVNKSPETVQRIFKRSIEQLKMIMKDRESESSV
ncbi:MAG: sigma-70 family RNA polymerase sigma factor [Planctomycetota bacterium]